MTGLRCPNCGFYNLSARAKCARCGKSLPELTPEQRNQFPEDEASGSGSLSAITGEVITQTTRISPETPVEPPEADPLPAGVVSEPAPEPMPEPEQLPEIKTEPAPEMESQELPEPELLPEPEAVSPPPEEKLDSQDLTAGSEYVPEVPSFDSTSPSRSELEQEAGDLSNFFKDVKRKTKPAEAREPEPIASAESVVKVAAPEDSEASLSQIGMEGESSGTPSFKPDFNKSLFPDFGEGSGDKADQESSQSAVSSPLAVTTGRIALAGLADVIIYLGIAASLVLAGQWASGVFAGEFSRLELALFFGPPLLLATLIVVWFYQVFFIAVLGQTPGGMLFGIEVMVSPGKRPRILKAGLRALVYVLCLAPLGLGFLPALFGNSLPDRVARTKPVRW